VGPANRSLFYEIWRSSSPAPHCSPHDWEVDVRIHNRDMAVRRLAGTVTAVLPNSEAVLPLLGQNLSARRSSADPPRRCLRAHCCSARLGSPVASHHYPHARRRDGTTCRLAARRAQDALPSDQAGLPWCQPTCPVCQWQAILLTWAHPAHLSAFNMVVGLESCEEPSATGTWQGQPRSYHGGGMWRHQTPPPGEGGPSPRSRSERSGPWRSGRHTWRPRTSLGSPGPRGHPRAPLPS
jgi:hypothetical protein